MNQQAFTIKQFIETFGVGRTVTYEEIQTGRLKTYKLGRRRYISRQAADSWQQRLEAQTTESDKVVCHG